jgi:hypothetical protein
MGASVRQRLLNHAKANGRPFAEVLQYYAMERFLYRLSMSPHVEAFTLKGALLLTAWQAPISRPTMDIDLLGRTDNAVEAIVALMREISQAEVTDDGIVFDSSSFAGEVIREDADYAGVRTTFVGRVDSARVHMQIDIGFGDVMTPGPETLTYPTILDFPAPTLSGYSRETVVAEKLQAVVQLRMLNTRMKDYFDLWLLTSQPELSSGATTCSRSGCRGSAPRQSLWPSARSSPAERSANEAPEPVPSSAAATSPEESRDPPTSASTAVNYALVPWLDSCRIRRSIHSHSSTN